ncbi:hypothetical protein SSX86_018827 [Deinandra increscens subsp. villosa]|uniref:Uncharacterized protein n=1 Tax=Deinandra increscens subsp. villosa TaxID=3103831 RepID=A0AAP0CRG3_9ASTR
MKWIHYAIIWPDVLLPWHSCSISVTNPAYYKLFSACKDFLFRFIIIPDMLKWKQSMINSDQKELICWPSCFCEGTQDGSYFYFTCCQSNQNQRGGANLKDIFYMLAYTDMDVPIPFTWTRSDPKLIANPKTYNSPLIHQSQFIKMFHIPVMI